MRVSVAIGPQASSSSAAGGRTPPRGVPGVPPPALFAFFLAFLGPEEKKQNLRKRGKVFSGKEKTSRNGKKKKNQEKPPQNGSGPAPRDLGLNVGNLGPEHTRKWALWGVWGPARAPGAIWAEKRGFWVRVTAQAQNRLRNGDLGSQARPGRKIGLEKRNLGRKMGSDRGIRG